MPTVLATVAAGVALLATPAEAGTIELTRVTSGSGAYALGNGGEFQATSFTGMELPALGSSVQVGNGIFQTFCIEKNEFVGLGTCTWVLNTGAVAGGLGGQTAPGFDPISEATAYLYTKFWNGTLSNYEFADLGDGAGERGSSASELQQAIWYLEGESSTAPGSSTQAWAWIQEALEATDADGYLDDWGGGIGDVRVLNIRDAGGIKRQDMLVMVMVPLPPASLLGLGLLSGVGAWGAVRRRRRRD